MQTSCSSLAVAGSLRSFHGLRVFDERIGPVGQRHDQPHGPAVVAVFVGSRDFVARLRRLRANRPPSSGYFADKPVVSTNFAVRLARFTTLPTRSVFTLADELVEVQIEVVDAATTSFEA